MTISLGPDEELRVSHLVPEGDVFRISHVDGPSYVVVAPLTAWSFQHGGRYPLLTRYSRGAHAFDLDRRKRR